MNLLLALAVAVFAFFGAAMLIVQVLTWVLFNVPGSPWPRLCRSQSAAAATFTALVALVAYIAVPGYLAWLAGLAIYSWSSS